MKTLILGILKELWQISPKLRNNVPNSLQIQFRGPLFCPFSKWDGAYNGPHFPMILRWRTILKWDGVSNGPRSHFQFCREFWGNNQLVLSTISYSSYVMNCVPPCPVPDARRSRVTTQCRKCHKERRVSNGTQAQKNVGFLDFENTCTLHGCDPCRQCRCIDVFGCVSTNWTRS